MKVLKIIRNIFVSIIALIYFTFVIAMTILMLSINDFKVPQIGNTALLTIKEEISSDKYVKGDLVLVEYRKLDKIKVGSEIFVYQLDKRGNVSIDLGTISQVHLEDDAITFKNGATYSMDLVVGEPTKVYNEIGLYLSIILSSWGFLFLILVPSFLIFIYEFYVLIVEIKYGKDDFEDDLE